MHDAVLHLIDDDLATDAYERWADELVATAERYLAKWAAFAAYLEARR